MLVFALALCMISCGDDKKDDETSTDTLEEGIKVEVADVDDKDINDGWSPVWKP